MLLIRRASMHEAETLLNQRTWAPGIAYVGDVDGRCVGAAGLAWGHGRCWLWLNVVEKGHATGRLLLGWARKLRRMSQALGDTAIYALRDAGEPTSERLLKLAGFKPTDEILDAREVWQWHS